MHVRTKTAVELQKALDAQRSQKKRNRQSQRINSEQEDALGDGVLRRSESQDHRQNRPHARSPAEGEGKADQERTTHRASALHSVQPFVRIERLDAQQSGQMQAE